MVGTLPPHIRRAGHLRWIDSIIRRPRDVHQLSVQGFDAIQLQSAGVDRGFATDFDWSHPGCPPAYSVGSHLPNLDTATRCSDRDGEGDGSSEMVLCILVHPGLLGRHDHGWYADILHERRQASRSSVEQSCDQPAKSEQLLLQLPNGPSVVQLSIQPIASGCTRGLVPSRTSTRQHGKSEMEKTDHVG